MAQLDSVACVGAGTDGMWWIELQGRVKVVDAELREIGSEEERDHGFAIRCIQSLQSTYQPAQGYTGPDEVLLSTSKNVVSAGVAVGGCNNSGSEYHTSTVTSNISIKLNVTGN